MRDSDFIGQLRYRLLKLGCPPGRMRKMVQEMSDHREDLKQAGRTEGMSEIEAESQANARLGDPQVLAGQLITVLRRSSWWGRHELFSFLLLPLLTVPLLWALALFLNLSAAYALAFGWNPKKLHAATANPITFHHLTMVFQTIDFTAMALATIFFCWLARRSGVAFGWLLAACAVCSLHASFIGIFLMPRAISINLLSHPYWLKAIEPFLIAGLIYVRQWWMTRAAERQIAD